MKVGLAVNCNDAIVSTNHPRTDFRTDEAKRYVAWIKAYLQKHIVPGKEVLDIGCGSGKQTFALEELGLTCVGVDCSTDSIKKSEEIGENLGSNCKFHVGDYTKTDFSPNSFDYALFHKNIVECSYEEYEQVVDHLWDLLRPLGILFLTMKQGELTKHDVVTGKSIHPTITIPEVGTFEYPTYFWSVSFMNHITSRGFELQHNEILDRDKQTYLFVYRRKSENNNEKAKGNRGRMQRMIKRVLPFSVRNRYDNRMHRTLVPRVGMRIRYK